MKELSQRMWMEILRCDCTEQNWAVEISNAIPWVADARALEQTVRDLQADNERLVALTVSQHRRIAEQDDILANTQLHVASVELAALKPAAERDRAALESMVWQFANRGKRVLTTGGLSALEEAFDALGWSDPYPTNDGFCDEPGCDDEATCGWPAPNGYRRTCGVHYPPKLAVKDAAGKIK